MHQVVAALAAKYNAAILRDHPKLIEERSSEWIVQGFRPCEIRVLPSFKELHFIQPQKAVRDMKKLGDIACARTPDPPGARSSIRISGTRRWRERQKSSLLKERRNSCQQALG